MYNQATTITSSLNKTQRILITLAVAGMISGVSFATTAFVSAANHDDTETVEMEDQILEILLEDEALHDQAEAQAGDNEPIHYGEDDDRQYSERAHESGVADEVGTPYGATTESETPVTTMAPTPISANQDDPIGQVLNTVIGTVTTIQTNLEAGNMTEEEAEQLITDLMMVVSLLAALTTQ